MISSPVTLSGPYLVVRKSGGPLAIAQPLCRFCKEHSRSRCRDVQTDREGSSHSSDQLWVTTGIYLPPSTLESTACYSETSLNSAADSALGFEEVGFTSPSSNQPCPRHIHDPLAAASFPVCKCQACLHQQHMSASLRLSTIYFLSNRLHSFVFPYLNLLI